MKLAEDLFESQVGTIAPLKAYPKYLINGTMFQKSFDSKAGVVTALMLLVALAPMPYGYYSLLRIVCFTYFLIRSIRLKDQNTSFPFIASIILCLTYNPVVKTTLSRESWIVINILTVAIIIKFLSKNEEPAAR